MKKFERNFKNLYNDNNIEIKNYYLKYLFKKYQKICFPKGSDEIFIYSNYIEDLRYFCRSISKSFLYDSKNKIIEPNHIIFFTELSIKRLIISKNLLIDGTFTYPKGYYQTIIIMFYDPLLFKIIPGIFIGFNNKTFQGYTLIFRFIRDYIYKYCQNDLSKIKWKVFTTDFEENLFNSFQKVFKKIEYLEHKGCFFHYLKNIRKYLVKNGFTKKKMEDDYKYIIKTCYNLPFKKNIQKNIGKEFKNAFRKKNKYKDFENYFSNQWEDFFKNKTLCLEKIAIKFRTTNSLENFNRIFKNEFNKKGEIDFVEYVDTLIVLAKEQKEYFEKELKSIPKKSIEKVENKIKMDNKGEEEENSEDEFNICAISNNTEEEVEVETELKIHVHLIHLLQYLYFQYTKNY